jgi:hypothetical protein
MSSSLSTSTSPAVTRFLPLSFAAASRADAGDCFEHHGRAECLPGLINIGVQKAGTGELQTWLGVHPAVTVHGGEVHFFDKMRDTACSRRRRSALRLQYARALWRNRNLQPVQLRGHILYEKTPAYFDLASPRLVACAVPSARLLVMLRDPTSRARSAYAMCQREAGAAWCRAPFEVALGQVLDLTAISVTNGSSSSGSVSGTPRAKRRTLRNSPHLRRMLLMGHYATYLRSWLAPQAFRQDRLRVLWLEQFKVDPFACLRAVEQFAGLPAHNYRAIATRNAAGLYVVGKSKSSSAATSAAASTPTRARGRSAAADAAGATLRAYYAPWQRRLGGLLLKTNTSLLPLGQLPHQLHDDLLLAQPANDDAPSPTHNLHL